MADEYTTANVQVIEVILICRHRTRTTWIASSVYEILDNAVDEAQPGYATEINVVLHDDNSVSVTDNGREGGGGLVAISRMRMGWERPFLGWRMQCISLNSKLYDFGSAGEKKSASWVES